MTCFHRRPTPNGRGRRETKPGEREGLGNRRNLSDPPPSAVACSGRSTCGPTRVRGARRGWMAGSPTAMMAAQVLACPRCGTCVSPTHAKLSRGSPLVPLQLPAPRGVRLHSMRPPLPVTWRRGSVERPASARRVPLLCCAADGWAFFLSSPLSGYGSGGTCPGCGRVCNHTSPDACFRPDGRRGHPILSAAATGSATFTLSVVVARCERSSRNTRVKKSVYHMVGDGGVSAAGHQEKGRPPPSPPLPIDGRAAFPFLSVDRRASSPVDGRAAPPPTTEPYALPGLAPPYTSPSSPASASTSAGSLPGLSSASRSASASTCRRTWSASPASTSTETP